MNNKEALRKHYLAKRNNVSTQKADLLSEQLCEQFFNTVCLDEVDYLHIYLPIVSKKEIDTWKIIHRIWIDHPHVSVVVPVSDFKKKTIRQILLSTGTQIIDDEYGIPTPVDGVEVEANKTDLVVAPLLVADTKGYRVGYGKGFYDRFFASCKQDVKKIGLSFFPPIDQISDTDEYDIALDQVIYIK